MIDMTYEQLETLGAICEKAENYLAATALPLPAHIHVEGLTRGITEIKEIAETLYRELGGES